MTVQSFFFFISYQSNSIGNRIAPPILGQWKREEGQSINIWCRGGTTRATRTGLNVVEYRHWDRATVKKC